MTPRVEADERPGYFRFIHRCKGGMLRTSVLPGAGGDGWDWDPEAGTVAPSIHCQGCGTHGFWENGTWRPA